MLRTVMPVSAASCSIVRSFSATATGEKLPLCDVTLIDVTPVGVTVISVMSKVSSRPRLRLLDAFAGPHGVDGFLEPFDPLLVRGEGRAEVVAVEHGTAESVTLRLRPNRAWRGFEAGQFVNVAVEIDGVRHQRCYSPASVAGSSRELEITVKRHPEGLVSNFLADQALPGMVLGLSAAEGDFALPAARPD